MYVTGDMMSEVTEELFPAPKQNDHWWQVRKTMENGRSDNKKRHSGSTLFLVALTAIMTLVAVSVGVAISFAALRDDHDSTTFDYAKLWEVVYVDEDGDLSVPQVDGWEAPSITVDGVFPVRGTRCNSSTESVPASVNLWWERTDLESGTGRVSQVDDLKVLIEPGCFTITFELDVPEEVAESVNNSPVSAESWKLVGTSRPDKPHSLVSSWESEPVWITVSGLPVVSPPDNERTGGYERSSTSGT